MRRSIWSGDVEGDVVVGDNNREGGGVRHGFVGGAQDEPQSCVRRPALVRRRPETGAGDIHARHVGPGTLVQCSVHKESSSLHLVANRRTARRRYKMEYANDGPFIPLNLCKVPCTQYILCSSGLRRPHATVRSTVYTVVPRACSAVHPTRLPASVMCLLLKCYLETTLDRKLRRPRHYLHILNRLEPSHRSVSSNLSRHQSPLARPPPKLVAASGAIWGPWCG